MTDVSILGAGVMGSALAQALLHAGRTVTVWNRSRAKAESLGDRGAELAADPACAVRASAVSMICVTDYAASYAALELADLKHKVIVQLGTGSPSDARHAAAHFRERGAYYLDGAILAVPSQIGRSESTILLSGSERAFAEAKPLLEVLAGSVLYLGAGPGSAAALDLSVLSTLFGALLGLYHGARVAVSEQVDLELLGSVMGGVAPALGGMLQGDVGVIQRGDFSRPEATLQICYEGMRLLAKQAREAGLEDSFPAFAVGQFERGMAAGYAQESPAALVKVLASSRNSNARMGA